MIHQSRQEAESPADKAKRRADTGSHHPPISHWHHAPPCCLPASRAGSVARPSLEGALFALRLTGSGERSCSSASSSWDEKYRSEEHTSELQSRSDIVCRLLLE